MNAIPADVINSTNDTAVFRFIPLSALQRSKKNMRTVQPKNDPDDAQLHQSIGHQGLIENLVVYQHDCGDYFVAAGGRRFSSLKLHVKEGNLDKDALIPCMVVPEIDATNVSLMENFQRKAPHPADTYTAFAALVNEGRSSSEIAKQHGLSELEVARFLRLGQVHKTLFKHFKADKLSLDQVMAYAATADAKRQIAVFKALGEDTEAAVFRIRKALLNNRYASDTALVRFIGVAAYEAAGGAAEHDLFSNTQVLCDVELITELAQAKLDAAAEQQTGWGWVETSTGGASSTFDYQRLTSHRLNVPDVEQKKLTSLQTELDKLDAIDEEQWTDELNDRYSRIEDEHSALEVALDDKYTGYNDDDKPYAGCIVTINQRTGELEIIRGLLRKADVKRCRNKGKEDAAPEKPKAVSVTNVSNDDLSAKLADDLGKYRRAAIKAALVKSPQVAIALLHFQLCVAVLGKGEHRYCRILALSVSEVSNDTSIDDYKASEAGKALAEARSKLDTGWLSLKTTQKQFEAFRALSSAKRNALLAYCAATQLSGGDLLPGKDKLIDALVDEIALDFVDYWRPCAENYFQRLTRPVLLALGKKWYGAAWSNAHTTDAKKLLVSRFDQLFRGPKKSLNDKEITIRDHWLPPQFRK